MDFNIFLYVGLILFVALLSTRIMKKLSLPNVTGYIITGIIVGPFVFGLLFNNFTYDGIKDSLIYSFTDSLKWISSVALGFIAFSIGTSFKKDVLLKTGKRIILITLFEALGGTLVVLVVLLIGHFIFPQYISIELVLTLAAIASATAPAATLMVIKQYNAHGSLVNTLLPVVALDDAVALILFSILFQIANTISGGAFDLYKTIFKPIIEIILSLSIGAVLGLLISFLNRFFKSRNNRIILCISAIFLTLGIYYLFTKPYMGGFELSSLLMCMMMGAMYANMRNDTNPTLDMMDHFTAPIYMLFFVISGASLDLSLFFSGQGLVVVIIALIYLFARMIGKWSGAYLGASFTRSEPKIKKYLGLTLVPQAGVAIGLATTASALFANNPQTEQTGSLIIAIVLTSTLIYELVGPLLSKFALKKAGEIS